MNFEIFKKRITDGLKEYYKDRVDIRPCRVTKNNGLILDGLHMMKKDETVTPTIYLNGYYEAYKDGTTIGKLVNQIVKTYEESRIEEEIDMSFFLDYEIMKNRVVCKLINYDRNIELLDDVPYIKYMDLAIVFYCCVIHDRLKKGTIMIHNNHMDSWNISVEQLYQDALQNNKRLLGTELKNMNEIMLEMFSENPEYMSDEETVRELLSSMESKDTIPMYVMTNRERQNGAACILNTESISEFANDIDRDVYILPSSIHEVILIPEYEGQEPASLARMVHEVNETQVGPDEILSDSVYMFQRSSNQILSVYTA